MEEVVQSDDRSLSAKSDEGYMEQGWFKTLEASAIGTRRAYQREYDARGVR